MAKKNEYIDVKNLKKLEITPADRLQMNRDFLSWARSKFDEKNKLGTGCIYRISDDQQGDSVLIINGNGACAQVGNVDAITPLRHGYCKMKYSGASGIFLFQSQLIPIELEGLVNAVFANPFALNTIQEEIKVSYLDEFAYIGTVSLIERYLKAKTTEADSQISMLSRCLDITKIKENMVKFKAMVESINEQYSLPNTQKDLFSHYLTPNEDGNIITHLDEPTSNRLN